MSRASARLTRRPSRITPTGGRSRSSVSVPNACPWPSRGAAPDRPRGWLQRTCSACSAFVGRAPLPAPAGGACVCSGTRAECASARVDVAAPVLADRATDPLVTRTIGHGASCQRIGMRRTCLFCAWLAWSRFRVVIPRAHVRQAGQLVVAGPVGEVVLQFSLGRDVAHRGHDPSDGGVAAEALWTPGYAPPATRPWKTWPSTSTTSSLMRTRIPPSRRSQ